MLRSCGYADMIVRADVSIKKLKKRIMKGLSNPATVAEKKTACGYGKEEDETTGPPQFDTGNAP